MSIAAIISIIISLSLSFYITKPQQMMSSLWISHLLTGIGCVLLLSTSPTLSSLLIIQCFFLIGESFSYSNLSLLSLRCIGYRNFCNQVISNESYRHLGGFVLTLIVYLSFTATYASSLHSAALCCLIMRLVCSIATMLTPLDEMMTWETLEEHHHADKVPFNPSTASTYIPFSLISGPSSGFFFFVTIFLIILFNSLIHFSLLHNIFISTSDSDVASTYWILSLLITQATLIGSTLLTSVLVPEIGKIYSYAFASLLITVRGVVIFFLLHYSSPITYLLFTYILDGYSSGIISVLIIVDCEQFSR